MKFTFVIPVYNVAPWLRQCLDSVLGQTLGDWEAVCINDGSTDGSPTILEEYATRDPRFRIVNQANRGLSAARNAGLDAAQGDYLLFLDSDDWLEANTLKTISDHLQGEDMLCFGGRRYDEADGTFRPADTLPSAVYDSGMDYYNANALTQRDFAFVCVVLRCYRRQFLTDHSLRFREGILHEDNLFTPQACRYARRVAVIGSILYNYRLREGSIMTTRSLRSRHDILLIANELAAFFTNNGTGDRSVAYRAVTHHYQAAFMGATRQETNTLRPLVDWRLYRAVSRTRPRHRLNYTLLRLSPTLFRLVNRIRH